MAITAAVVLAVGGTAVQANQSKIANQKQKDAAGDAEAKQNQLLTEQKQQDADRKKKEDAALQQGFMKTAASRTRSNSGGALPGAVAASPYGSTIGSNPAGKRLIGS